MAVSSVSAYSTAASSEVTQAVTSELDKDAFLKLLIAELSNQDPLNPMDDREFIAQMAQFSTLEQMTNMTKALEDMASMENYSAVSYVGKMVAFDYTDSEGTVTPVADVVVAVWFDSTDGVMLETATYGDIPLKQIDGVTTYSAASAS
ncbi:MAG: flagellar hook assembly protein FlgD [Synergistaceae bacterium]|jgi:flagellar basal-body rod modification protein FlgD|nr:flagellar hook assembly protein FlgD [Synergistaceae bacterium]